ncbi:MAG: type II toxin-antitoxin system Phd/YefM family antitoxin [Burkholderiales bacterium]|jgi:prevent-host-death family protein
MKYSTNIKPITWLKAHSADVLTWVNEHREPIVITQNGEARAVLQDVGTYEQTQETLALLKILALGQQQIDAGQVTPADQVIAQLKSGPKPSRA